MDAFTLSLVVAVFGGGIAFGTLRSGHNKWAKEGRERLNDIETELATVKTRLIVVEKDRDHDRETIRRLEKTIGDVKDVVEETRGLVLAYLGRRTGDDEKTNPGWRRPGP